MSEKPVIDKADKLVQILETMRIADYVQLLENKKRMLWLNFLIGLARGFGSAVGFTLLGAILIFILQRIVDLNLPLIGYYISELIKIIQQHLQ